MIYERIYDSLYPKVEYDKCGNCTNQQDLEKMRDAELVILNCPKEVLKENSFLCD